MATPANPILESPRTALGQDVDTLELLPLPIKSGSVRTTGGGAGGSATPVCGSTGSVTDGSGTITTGGVDQTVFAANSSRCYLFFQNLSDTVMYLNFGAAATAGAGSVQVAASGGAFVMEGTFISGQAIHVFCATTGKAFTAKQA